MMVSSASPQPPPPAPLIHVRGLTKLYHHDPALQDVDFDVPAGSMVLLVGPNGAGKSTLLSVLMDLVPFGQGTVEVFGRSPATEGARIRAGCGFLPEAMEFPFGTMKVRDILAFLARFRPSWDPGYAERLGRQLELGMDRKWKKLSKGQARRVQLVATLAHRPPLLLLDEPTDGLDPVIRETVLGILAEHMAETETTVLFSTHGLHEAQGLADRLLVLKDGRVWLQEDVDTLRQTLFRVDLRCATPPKPPSGMLIRDEAQREGVGAEGTAERGAPGQAAPVELRWVMRGSAAEVRGWAAGAGAEIREMRPLTVSEAALAYLSSGAPAPRPSSNHAGAGDGIDNMIPARTREGVHP
ncbi:hypothetical protein BH23GEM11_BH23GEM11_16440 [soil metagenome]